MEPWLYVSLFSFHLYFSLLISICRAGYLLDYDMKLTKQEQVSPQGLEMCETPAILAYM